MLFRIPVIFCVVNGVADFVTTIYANECLFLSIIIYGVSDRSKVQELRPFFPRAYHPSFIFGFVI
jgi:hypothetical protein